MHSSHAQGNAIHTFMHINEPADIHDPHNDYASNANDGDVGEEEEEYHRASAQQALLDALSRDLQAAAALPEQALPEMQVAPGVAAMTRNASILPVRMSQPSLEMIKEEDSLATLDGGDGVAGSRSASVIEPASRSQSVSTPTVVGNPSTEHQHATKGDIQPSVTDPTQQAGHSGGAAQRLYQNDVDDLSDLPAMLKDAPGATQQEDSNLMPLPMFATAQAGQPSSQHHRDHAYMDDRLRESNDGDEGQTEIHNDRAETEGMYPPIRLSSVRSRALSSYSSTGSLTELAAVSGSPVGSPGRRKLSAPKLAPGVRPMRLRSAGSITGSLSGSPSSPSSPSRSPATMFSPAQRQLRSQSASSTAPGYSTDRRSTHDHEEGVADPVLEQHRQHRLATPRFGSTGDVEALQQRQQDEDDQDVIHLDLTQVMSCRAI